MLAYIKKILRIASTEFDDEVNQLISACKEDLKLKLIPANIWLDLMDELDNQK